VIDLSLQGKVAVVTGGSKGLGKAVADRFAEAGATVVVASRNEDQLRLAVEDIAARGGTALAIPTDVAEPSQVEELMARTIGEVGSIDILVNNAGAAPFLTKVASSRGLDRFERYLHLNFMAAVYCTRAAAPHLLARRGSSVLNMSSVAGITAARGLSYYGAAKAALVGLTRSVAMEWAPAGVRVNALAPGVIRTDIYSRHRMIASFEKMAEGIPLGRVGEPGDVADAALFLCSPAASFITGAVLVIDGGATLPLVTEP
jgi:NAD(P)-dependent dehydrogenase (short-subunit alcohol dehydrogenase family)